MSNSNFLQNQAKYYNELLASQEMSDVTLACDGYEVGAHKTIISAASPFFRKIIRKSRNLNPYIYLKGVSQESLEALLKFIYNGEATARSENLENLVDVGNELQIEGLMEEKSKRQKRASNEKENLSTEKKKKDTAKTKSKDEANDFNMADFVKIEPYETEEEAEESDDIKDKQKVVDGNDETVGESNNQEELEEEIAKRMKMIVDEHSLKRYECMVCQKKQKEKTKMKMHVETHLEGFSHKCKFCGMVKKTTRALQLHVWDQHTRSKTGTEDAN